MLSGYASNKENKILASSKWNHHVISSYRCIITQEVHRPVFRFLGKVQTHKNNANVPIAGLMKVIHVYILLLVRKMTVTVPSCISYEALLFMWVCLYYTAMACTPEGSAQCPLNSCEECDNLSSLCILFNYIITECACKVQFNNVLFSWLKS